MSRRQINKTRIAIVTNIIPHYREDFYRRIFSLPEFDITVFCQREIPGSGLKTTTELRLPNVRQVRYLGITKEKFGVQLLPVQELISNFDAYIIHGNPRVISNVLISWLAKTSRKPIAIWGQARTANSKSFLENIKLSWWRQFSYLFVYNSNEVEFLLSKNFTRHLIIGMENGLDQAEIDNAIIQWPKKKLEDWLVKNNLKEKTLLLSCARIVQKNRFELAVAALDILRRSNNNVLWCVIGDGPEISRLQSMVEEKSLEDNVLWLGEIHEEGLLAPWFLSSKIFVHPSGIGLSLLHSFGYGLPVITHDDPHQQMPEFYALEPEVNGTTFVKDSSEDLARSISRLINAPQVREKMRENAQHTVHAKFNTKIMAKNFHTFAKALTSQ